MALIKLKPTSNGVRHQIRVKKSHLAKGKIINIKPTFYNSYKKGCGRSRTTGHITSWHKGGGCKKAFSNINFSNESYMGIVICVMYDSYRNSFVNLNFDLKNRKFFKTLAVKDIYPGSVIECNSSKIDYRLGYRAQIKMIPPGSLIHNLCTNTHRISSIIRAAGTYGQIIQCDSKMAAIKMPSGKTLTVPNTSMATIGINTNTDFNLGVLGKAGKNRLRGRRPIVRGIAMNPVDHPHGGRTNGGRPSVSPWGKLTKCGFYLKKRNKK